MSASDHLCALAGSSPLCDHLDHQSDMREVIYHVHPVHVRKSNMGDIVIAKILAVNRGAGGRDPQRRQPGVGLGDFIFDAELRIFSQPLRRWS